ncbi:hypothetical protein ABZ545_01405 [Streptomyces abikoensis]|uniref:hypothetical protein n=1 Tax=Streptomyces abikoensis TaxID=97398 RepID=UPI0033FF1CBE
MSIALQVGLGRARVALLVAGLAWLLGIQVDVALRAVIGALVVAALCLDGMVDDRTIADAIVTAKPPPHDDYRPAA